MRRCCSCTPKTPAVAAAVLSVGFDVTMLLFATYYTMTEIFGIPVIPNFAVTFGAFETGLACLLAHGVRTEQKRLLTVWFSITVLKLFCIIAPVLAMVVGALRVRMGFPLSAASFVIFIIKCTFEVFFTIIIQKYVKLLETRDRRPNSPISDTLLYTPPKYFPTESETVAAEPGFEA
ncbi:hypothetical protein BV898_00337 [Hypsibius exemplaris]|uniref:Uncharacterized protein n=1 Tax=Hypsibius exemplaris TaxID=2072580 RepID=A0A1W0XFP6_HYPEX|nr:hypothetical protein BV898_00337 [Hypsibius exemplaris]